MSSSKLFLVGVAIIAVGFAVYQKVSSRSYEPIVLLGETYVHVEDNEVNKIENHFFTPGGVAVSETDRFVQISKYDHPDLTAQQVSRVQQQVIHSFGLRAVEGYPDRFFGVFEGTVPVYGYMAADAFLLQVGPKNSGADEAALLAASDARITALSEIRTDF